MKSAALILDASLLVLFVVGTTSRGLIERHKRLKAFTVEDFDLLCRLIAGAPQVVVTPNILTEASNLLRQIEEPARSRILETFRQVVLTSDEEYLASRNAVGVNEFLRLGLTDSASLEVVRDTRSLLTTDLDLYLSAVARGRVALNFNHLREQHAAQ